MIFKNLLASKSKRGKNDWPILHDRAVPTTERAKHILFQRSTGGKSKMLFLNKQNVP